MRGSVLFQLHVSSLSDCLLFISVVFLTYHFLHLHISVPVLLPSRCTFALLFAACDCSVSGLPVFAMGAWTGARDRFALSSALGTRRPAGAPVPLGMSGHRFAVWMTFQGASTLPQRRPLPPEDCAVPSGAVWGWDRRRWPGQQGRPLPQLGTALHTPPTAAFPRRPRRLTPACTERSVSTV